MHDGERFGQKSDMGESKAFNSVAERRVGGLDTCFAGVVGEKGLSTARRKATSIMDKVIKEM